MPSGRWSRLSALLAIIAGTWLLTRALYSFSLMAGYRFRAAARLWSVLLRRLQPATEHPWAMLLLGLLWIAGANLELFQSSPQFRSVWLLSGLAGLVWTGRATTLAALAWTVPLSVAMLQESLRARVHRLPPGLQ